MSYSNKFLIAPFCLYLLACSTTNPPEPVIESSLYRTTEGALNQEEIQTLTLTGIIDRIDYATRLITIKNSAGEKRTIAVAKDVQRLNEMKVGDTVTAEFTEALGIEVRSATPEELKNPNMAVAVLAKADKDLPPGILAGTITKSVVKIHAINMEKETVDIQLSNGTTKTVKVRYPENLERVKVGDTVVVTVVESVALKLTPQ